MKAEEDTVYVVDPTPCELCGQVPNDWKSFGEEIFEECEGVEGKGAEYQASHFHAYKLYTCFRLVVL